MKPNPFKEKIVKTFEDLLNPNKPKWVYLCIFSLFIIGLISHFADGNIENQSKAITEGSIESADTYIPNGYVLVPLEVNNANVLSNLMGQFTFVDIYSLSDLSDHPKKLIAQNLRLVKAPHDDSLFAALVAENEIDLIHKLSNPVFVVIKNPKINKTELIPKDGKKKTTKTTSRILYGI